jgi:hypothetical protein
MYFRIQPLMQNLNRLIILISMLMLAGCMDEIEKIKLSEEDKLRVLQIQNPFGENYVRFSVSGQEYPVVLGVSACKLYRAKLEREVVTEWIKIPKLSSFYPTGSACERQSIKYDGKYVMYSYCAIAIGAGGGCGGGGGDFRSINGRDWERLDDKNKWKSIGNEK